MTREQFDNLSKVAGRLAEKLKRAGYLFHLHGEEGKGLFLSDGYGVRVNLYYEDGFMIIEYLYQGEVMNMAIDHFLEFLRNEKQTRTIKIYA